MTVVEVLKQACREVYAEVKDLTGTPEGREKGSRGAGGDISRRIDLVAEKSVIDFVKSKGIKATIIGEECGVIKGEGGYLIIDSIDGTTNAVSGIPFFCCSLAYATDYRLSAVADAAVIDLTNGNLYHASKDKGAFLDDKKIKAKSKVDDSDTVIGLNISKASEDVVERLKPVISNAGHVRHFGANALELCYLAHGLLDAYIDFRGKIRVTDMAAAYLIVREAGGQLYSPDGSLLDSSLGMDARMSFFAVANDIVSKKIKSLLL